MIYLEWNKRLVLAVSESSLFQVSLYHTEDYNEDSLCLFLLHTFLPYVLHDIRKGMNDSWSI